MLLLLILVMKCLSVCELKETADVRSFHFSSSFNGKNDNTNNKEPYKTITGKNFKDSRKYLIDGALACISDLNCLSFNTDGNGLRLYKCNEEAFNLKTRCPCESGRTYLRHLDLCYEVISKKVSWEVARDKCAINGGSLLVLNTAEKYHGFLQAFDDPVISWQLWVGARWVTNAFFWLNGDELPIDSPNWHEGEPLSPENGLVLLGHYYGKWALDDHLSYSRFGFICEY